MSWHLGTLLPLDTETTGVSVERDRIVTACLGIVDGAGKRPPDLAHLLIDPGIDIPAGAARIHGWTTERIAAAENVIRPARDGIEFVTDLLARLLIEEPAAPLVAHNAPFDLTILDRECRRHDLPTLPERLGRRPLYVVDTYVLSMHLEPHRRRVSETQGAHQLKTCAQVYGIGWDDAAAHDAQYDALMAVRVAWKIAHRNPQIARMPLPELHRRQVEWKAEQAEGLRDHFRSKGKYVDDVPGEWPVIPPASQMQIGAA